MTLIEKVKAAIADPSLFTDELIHEAMGECSYDDNFIVKSELASPIANGVYTLLCMKCGKRFWDKHELDWYRKHQPVLPYLTDYYLVMPEMIKRKITHVDFFNSRTWWAKILADMIEKGEIR